MYTDTSKYCFTFYTKMPRPPSPQPPPPAHLGGPGQWRKIISPACPKFAPELSPGWTCPKHCLRVVIINYSSVCTTVTKEHSTGRTETLNTAIPTDMADGRIPVLRFVLRSLALLRSWKVGTTEGWTT